MIDTQKEEQNPLCTLNQSLFRNRINKERFIYFKLKSSGSISNKKDFSLNDGDSN